MLLGKCDGLIFNIYCRFKLSPLSVIIRVPTMVYCAFANIDSSPPASPRPLQRASFSGSSLPLLPLAPPTPRFGEAGALELALEVAYLVS